MSCLACPAAYVIHGVARLDAAVLCRVESTERGQRDAKAGPVAIVRAGASPASLHGYCLGDLPAFADDVDLLGFLATEEERRAATAARASGARPSYRDCPSWRAEFDNRHARGLVELPNTERRVLEPGRAT